MKRITKEEFISDLKKAPIPNGFTILRMILGIILIPFYFLGLNGIMTAVFIAAAVTDKLDGYFAKKYNQKTETGALLDASCDKGLGIIGGIIAALINGTMFVIPLAFETFILLMNSLREIIGNEKVHSNLAGRIKQWPLMITIGVGILCSVIQVPVNIIHMLIGITAFSQSITIIDYVLDSIKQTRIKNKIEKPFKTISDYLEEKRNIFKKGKKKDNVTENVVNLSDEKVQLNISLKEKGTIHPNLIINKDRKELLNYLYSEREKLLTPQSHKIYTKKR